MRGLELGADDYVTKPFSPRKLTSRIRAVLRRGSFADQTDTGKIDVDGRLQIDFDRHEVWVDGGWCSCARPNTACFTTS